METRSTTMRQRVADSPAWIALPLAAGFAMFLPRITGGGFTSDDWSNRGLAANHGPIDQLSEFFDMPLAHRVLHIPYTSLYSNVFGEHAWLYICWAILTAGLVGAGVALLLRRFGVPTWVAGLIGAMGVIFPYSSITKIWITAHIGHTGTLLALIGIGLGIRALTRPSTAGFAGYRVAALVFLLLSLDMYEIALPLIGASGVAYWLAARHDRAVAEVPGPLPTRRIAISWGTDLLLVAVWYAAIRGETMVGGTSATPLLERLGTIALDGGRVLAGAFAPFLVPEQAPDGDPLYSGAHFSSGAAVLALVLVGLVAAVALAVGLSRPERRSAARWGAGIVVALVCGYAGWIAIVPAADFYRPVPLSAATNRVNVLAAFGLGGVVVCTIGALVSLLGPVWRRLPPAAPFVAGALALAVVTAAYARHIRAEIGLWNRASQEQERVLEGLRLAYAGGAPAPGTKVFLTDNAEFIADGAEVFHNSWGFPAALRLTFQDFTLSGAPHRSVAVYDCRSTGMVPYYLQYRYKRGDEAFTPYGALDFVSVEQRRVWHVTDQASCVAAVQESGMTLMPEGAETPPIGST